MISNKSWSPCWNHFCLLILLICILPNGIPEVIVPQKEIDALIDFYDSLNGPDWECQWNITAIKNGNLYDKCYIIVTEYVYFENEPNITYESVSSINMYIENSSGTLPSSLGDFTYLRSIMLYGLSITGNLPKTIGNLKYLNYFFLVNMGIHGTLPQSICNLTQLEQIVITNVNITGTIPSCLFKNNPNLDEIHIDTTKFYGTIPDSIGEATMLYYIELDDNPLLYGTIPETIGLLTKLQLLEIVYSNFNGTLPITLCNCSDFYFLTLWGVDITGQIPECLFVDTNIQYLSIADTKINEQIPETLCKANAYAIEFIDNTELYSSLPNCTTNFINLQNLVIAYNDKFYGSLPETYVCSAELRELSVYLNQNMRNNKVPKCLSNASKLYQLILAGNHFSGTFPPLLNESYLEILQLHDNQFIGNVSNIVQYPDRLESFSVHNNLFEGDVSNLLKTLIVNSSGLSVLSMYGNSQLTGTFPTFDVDLIDNHTRYLLLHSMNMYGSLPSHLTFTRLEYLSLYNNRLSCKIPSSFVRWDHRYCDNCSLIIPSNLFQCDNYGNFPEFITSDFLTANNLYVTVRTQILSVCLFIMGCTCIIFVVLTKIKRQKHTGTASYKELKEIGFIKDISVLQNSFNDWKLILLVVLLLILYPISSNYYKCSPLISWFTLSWFYSDMNSWNDWVFGILSLFINIMFCHIVCNLMIVQLQSANISKTIEKQQELLITEKLSIEYNVQHKYNKYTTLIKLLFYLFGYVLGIAMIIFYLFCESLPNNNILFPSEFWREVITIQMPFVLAIDNVLIVPNLIDSFNKMFNSLTDGNRRTESILLLRTVNMVVVPVIGALFLLNDCGKHWTQYWKPCLNNAESQVFNVSIAVYELTDGTPDHIQVLSSTDVCSPQTLMEIDFNKCIRSFFYRWSSIIMYKFIIMGLMPIFIIFLKTIVNKINIYFNKQKNIKIQIDMEYTALITKFESVLTFSIISPLIIPIVLVAIESNKYFYKIMINKLNWKLTSYKNIQSSFPVQLLVIGIIFGQFLSSSFLIFCTYNSAVSYVIIIGLGVCDIFYFFLFVKAKKANTFVLNSTNVQDPSRW